MKYPKGYEYSYTYGIINERVYYVSDTEGDND